MLWFFLAPGSAQFQANASHILFGDLRIAEQSSDARLPGSFRILLKDISGQVLRRQSISAGGRYRFLEVPNGEYILAVESNNVEQVQIRMLINEYKSTDIRRDLELAWHSKNSAADSPEPSPSTTYARKSSSQALFEEAQADLKANGLEAAGAKLEQVVADDPRDFEAWTELGNVQFKSEEWGDSRECYQKALQVRPDYLPALLNLGKLRMVREDYEEAIDRLSQATRLDPEQAEAFYLLGEACLQIKKGSQAVEYFLQALELEPLKMADAHLRMAALYNAAKYPGLAVREYGLFLKKRPDSPQRPMIEKLIAENQKP